MDPSKHHSVSISRDIDIRYYDHRPSVSIFISWEESSAFLLGLFLLLGEYIDTLNIRSHKFLVHASRMTEEPKSKSIHGFVVQPGGSDIKISGNIISINLSYYALQQITGFYMIYYRDGISPVNHIDIEGTESGSGGLVFMATAVYENRPLSEEYIKFMRKQAAKQRHRKSKH